MQKISDVKEVAITVGILLAVSALLNVALLVRYCASRRRKLANARTQNILGEVPITNAPLSMYTRPLREHAPFSAF